jgi:hypothetical protein
VSPFGETVFYRRKVVRLGLSFLKQFFTDGPHAYSVIRDGLPEDARILNVRMDFSCRHIDLLVESDSFEPILEGSSYPELCPLLGNIPIS